MATPVNTVGMADTSARGKRAHIWETMSAILAITDVLLHGVSRTVLKCSVHSPVHKCQEQTEDNDSLHAYKFRRCKWI